MNFLNPAYLWAFTALAIPLAIHLLSRKEGKIIRMGSLRHVRETPTRQFRSVRLNEYLLLLVRMIILALLVMFMSGVYLKNLRDSSKWLVIESGLEKREDLKPFFDSLKTAGFEQHFLLPGFPEQGDGQLPDYAARIEELTTLPVEEVVVVATNRYSGFEGPRISLPFNIKWIDVEGSRATVEVSRVQMSADSTFVQTGNFETGATTFSFVKNRGKGGRARDSVRVVVAFDTEFESDKSVMVAVLNAIRNETADVLTLSLVPAAKLTMPSADWLVWLSEAPLPVYADKVIFSGESQQSETNRFLERIAENRYRLNERITSETAITNNLAVQLMGILMRDDRVLAMADSLDSRVVGPNLAFSKESRTRVASLAETGNQVSTRYLLTALLFFIVLERLAAYRRNQ